MRLSASIALAVMACLSPALRAQEESSGATPDSPPARKGSAKVVTAQGGGEGTAAVMGAPPPIEGPADTRIGTGDTREPERTESATESVSSLAPSPRRAGGSVALRSAVEGEAVIEVDGQTRLVRRGSAVGGGIVKAVGAGRLVYTRPAVEGEPGDQALVIVTLDAHGRTRTRVLFSQDGRSGGSEATRP